MERQILGAGVVGIVEKLIVFTRGTIVIVIVTVAVIEEKNEELVHII